jgi:hypothetical protein
MTPKTAEIEESVLTRLLVPDALMPGQYYEGARRDDPATEAIKRLMLAVLEDALRCLQTYADARTPIRRRMFAEAEAWIADRTACGPFAFEAICEALGIEYSRLRDGIREWRLQLSSGMNSHRLKRRSIGRSTGPINSSVRRARRRINEREAPCSNSSCSALKEVSENVGP